MMLTNLGVLPNLQGDLKAKACWVARRMFADREVVFYVDDGKGIGIGSLTSSTLARSKMMTALTTGAGSVYTKTVCGSTTMCCPQSVRGTCLG